MSMKYYNPNQNPINGELDNLILIPLSGDYYKMQIAYDQFLAGATFKLYTIVGTNPIEAQMVEVADSEVTIADASGVVIYSNVDVEKADFLVLEYTSDSNAALSNYSIIMSSRS